MAGPYSSTFRLTNGQNLRVYQAANATVGSYANVEINGEVGSGSPTDFEVKSPCQIQDIITPQTAGIIEIVGGGVMSGISILLDATFTSANPNRAASLPRPGTYTMVPGRRYRLYQKTAGAA